MTSISVWLKESSVCALFVVVPAYVHEHNTADTAAAFV